MTLQNWLHNGWLAPHETSPQEITDLLVLVNRDLCDCQAQGLSADWRLNISYNAALQAATAALAASGYRAARDSHHFRIIQSLKYTIDAPPLLINKFDKFRTKRNIGGYERAGMVSDQEAAEMYLLAKQLSDDVNAWLQNNHANLLEKP